MNECREFEYEMWLYIEGSLREDRMRHWGDHLASCSACREMLNETKSFLKNYDELPAEDVTDKKFDAMVSNAVNSKNIFSVLRSALNSFFAAGETESVQYLKIAFGSALAVAAIVLLLLSEKPNTVKTVTSELLDWEGTKVNTQINDLKDQIQVIGNDNWSREIYSLDKKIDQMETDKDKFSFN